jgi:hypothetical protein
MGRRLRRWSARTRVSCPDASDPLRRADGDEDHSRRNQDESGRPNSQTNTDREHAADEPKQHSLHDDTTPNHGRLTLRSGRPARGRAASGRGAARRGEGDRGRLGDCGRRSRSRRVSAGTHARPSDGSITNCHKTSCGRWRHRCRGWRLHAIHPRRRPVLIPLAIPLDGKEYE